MKAQQLQDYLRSLDGGWMNLERTVDTFKAGSPDTEVTGIAVGWRSYTWALEQALALQCNVFVTHEPTYWDHRDKDERFFGLPRAAAKKRFVEQSGMVVIRCHDLWDQYPGIGIPDSWAAHLQLGEPLVSEGYVRVYDVTGSTAREVARNVSARTRAFGQDEVLLFGPADAPVSRLAIGTGAITPFFTFIKDYGADIGICTDDGMATWAEGSLAIDCGIPMVVVNHAVSEEPGVRNLAKHLSQAFPGVAVHHIPQGCMYQTVSV